MVSGKDIRPTPSCCAIVFLTEITPSPAIRRAGRGVSDATRVERKTQGSKGWEKVRAKDEGRLLCPILF